MKCENCGRLDALEGKNELIYPDGTFASITLRTGIPSLIELISAVKPDEDGMVDVILIAKSEAEYKELKELIVEMNSKAFSRKRD